MKFMDLTLIATKESDERLCELIEGLACDPGYGPGIAVKAVEGTLKKYALEIHRGTITDKNIAVRVVDRMIIAGQATKLIEDMLRNKEIGFEEYEEVSISEQRLNRKKLSIEKPEREPNLVYRP